MIPEFKQPLLRFIPDLISSWGITSVFTVSGATVDPLTHALLDDIRIDLIQCSHELGAAYAADGYARARSQPGVVLVNSSPGFSNLVSALVVAREEHIPLVVISGNVPTSFQQTGGFQGASFDRSVSERITKWTIEIQDPENAATVLENAFRLSHSYPMGPVHVIIPFDVQRGLTKTHRANRFSGSCTKSAPSPTGAETILPLLQSGKWIVYAGEHLNHLQCSERLIEFIERFKLPLVTTYGAKGIIPEHHTLHFGNAGFAGRQSANELLLRREIDGIVWLGTLMNERNSLYWNDRVLSRSRRHVVIGAAFEPVLSLLAEKAIHLPANPLLFLNDSMRSSIWDSRVSAMRQAWAESIARHKGFHVRHPQWRGPDNDLEPSALVHAMNDIVPDHVDVVVDSGQHRIFPGLFWKNPPNGRFFTSSIMAPTGWALCAAVGIGAASKGRPTLVITGDSCMRMHGMELQTAVRQGVPLIVVVFNNRALGAIHRRIVKADIPAAGFADGFKNDWTAFAHSIGADGFHIASLNEFAQVFTELCRSSGHKVTILDVPIVYPSYMPDSIHTRSAFA